MQDTKSQNFIKSAAILASASIFVKFIGAIYKIPLFQENVLGDVGIGSFQVTYGIYTLILTVATAGIPVALSRLIASAATRGDTALVKRYFSVALPAFSAIGIVAMLVMLLFADPIAGMMNNSLAAPGIRVLAPAVFFVCIISVYRGYTQGFENMIPTAISQIVEVLCKAAFGIAIALWMSGQLFETQYVSAGAIVGVTIGLGLCIPLLIRYKVKHDKLYLPSNAAVAGDAAGTDTAAVGTAAGTVLTGTIGINSSDISSAAPDGVAASGTVSNDAAAAITQVSDTSSASVPNDISAQSGNLRVLLQLLKVSIPITIGASFMTLMTVIDSSVVLGRLQSGLAITEKAASALYGIYTKGLTLYNLPSALVVPISVSIVPAIAAAIARGSKDDASGIMQSAVKLVNLLAMPASAGLIVLSGPILIALYNDARDTAAIVLMLLGAASFFVCLQSITMAILQANGHERFAMIAVPIGGAVQITLDYFLVANPSIGIIGSPIGTLVCFIVITTLNICRIFAKVPERPKFAVAFLKPFACTAVMAVVAFVGYKASYLLTSALFGSERMGVTAALVVAIALALITYLIMIIATHTITSDDIKLVPKGEKLAKLLRIR